MPQDPFDDIVKGYDQQFAPPKVKPVKPPKPPSFDDLVKDVDGQMGSASTPKAQRRQAIAGLQDELAQTTRQVKPGETRNLVTGQTYPTVTPKFQSPIDMRLNAPNEAQKAFDRAAAATGQQPAAPKPRNAFQAPRPKPMLERVMAQQAVERQQPQTVETDPQRMEQVRQATAQQLATQRQVRQVQAREDVAQMNPLQRMAVRGMAKAGGATDADIQALAPPQGVEADLMRATNAALRQAGSTVRGAGEVLPGFLPPAVGRLRKPIQQGVVGTAKGIESGLQTVGDTLAPDDVTDDSFRAKLGRGVGSVGASMGGALATGGGSLAAGTLGALANLGQVAEERERSGAPVSGLRQAGSDALAIATGMTEALGAGRLLNRLGMKTPVIQRVAQALEEGGQEYAQSYLNDLNAKLVAAYDPNRAIDDPLSRKRLEEALIGAILGSAGEIADVGGQRLMAAQETARQRPITQARQAIDARSAANAAAIAPQAQPITEPLTEPLTAPVQAAPVAAGRSQDFRRRGAQLLGEEIEEAAPVAPVTPQAAPVVQPVAQPAPEPTVTGALRAEADAAKIEAGELEQAGDFANAVNAYDAAHKNLKLLRRRLGTPKTPEDVSLINQIDREISLAATNRQKAKEQARGMARQANRPTAGLPEAKKLRGGENPQAQVPLNQVAEPAPLLRPDAVQNPEGGVPQMPEQSPTAQIQRKIDAQDAAQAKQPPAKRLVQRIKELGGIGIRHVGEMQGLKDARRVGILRNKPEMLPDVLAQQLRSEGYDVDPDDLNTLWAAIDRDIAGQERPANTAEINRRLAEDEAAWNEQQEARGTSQNFDQIVEEVDADFQPDTADLREVRAFGRKPQTEQFTEEPPTAPLARRRERIRPPAPASPRGVGNRPMTVDVAGERTPVAMSADFPRARREMVRAGREVDARLEMGQEKGDFGNVAEAMFKSNTPDVLHGQDSFFHDPDVKGKLGLTRDAEMADVRRELKTQLAKSLNLSVDEISLSHIKPEVWRAWAKQKGLGREAVRKLEAGIARAERKQRAVETNAQIVAEESQRAQADVRPAKARPADLEKQIKDIQALVGWTIDEAEAKRQIAALRARAAKDTKFDKMVTDEGRALRQEWGILKTFSASDMQGAVDNARVKTSADPANPRAGIIYINTNAKTVIDTIWEANGGSKFSAAIALDTPALESVADVLRYEASFLEGNDAKQVEALADAFSEMVSAKYDGAGLINVDLADYGYLDLARDHELFHVWQYGQSQPNNPTRTPMQVEWATKLPGYEKVRASLMEKGYSDDPEDLVREFAAYAATNDLERIGIAPNEAETVATEFLYEYFQQIAKQFGAQHLERIGRVSVPARSTIERVRDEIRTTQTAARTASQSRSSQQATGSPSRTAVAGVRLSDRTGTGGREGGETRIAARTSQEQGQPQRRTRASVENSPEFKRWFGDSKVVDKDGKPLVVYHGTESDFDVFDEDKIRRPGYGFGFHFAESSGLAGAYSKQGYGANKNVMPVYLSIKNPFTGDYYQFAAEIGTNWPPEIAAELKKRGYDGIRYNHGEWSESKGQSPYAWVAFSPSQIKSATGNRGTFNPASPRINEMRLNLPQEQGFSVGRLRNEPQGEFAASGLGGFQSLFDRKPKTKPARPVEKDWNAQKWAKKFYTDSILNALSPEDRAKYSQAKTDKERNAVVLQANLAPDLEAKVFQFIDDATDAFEKGNLQEAGEVVAKGREFMSGQLSDKARDVNWFDHMQSRLSNVNFKGTYERIAGEQGKEISEIFRNAQVDAANGKISRAEAVRRLRTELKPYVRRVKAAGKPGLARWVEHHIDAVSDPDQSFRGLAGFLKGFQYNTKLRLNPRSAIVNSLQPLQTLWPFVTTSEYNRLWLSAFKKENRTRINEILDREPMGSAEDVSNLGRKLKKIDLFTPVSRHNNRVGFLAGEMFADRKGLTGDAKMRMALDWAKKVEFDNSAYDIPPLFSGKIASVVGQFKPFMVKNLERIYSDWKSAPPEALATNTWKGAGTLARRSKMVAAQLAIGGVRSAVPGLKMIGGVVILGALAKAFSAVGVDDDKAEKMAEAVYFGAPGLIEQDLSGSVMIFDEPFGKTSYEKMVNFFGGPTLSLIAKGFEEGKNINEAEDTKKSTKAEKQQAAGLRLAKSITPLTKTAIALHAAYKGERPELSLDKKEPMTIPEAIGYGLQGTPLRQTKYWEKKEAPQIVKESKAVAEFLPNFFPRDEEKKGTRVTEEGEVETGMPQRRPGEPDAVYQKRVERVSGWMDEYGQKLLNHPRYQVMPEADQKAAIESLRRRIGAQQNLTRPKLSSLEPNAVLLGLQRSKAGKAKREREGKYLYTPQP